MKQPYRIGAHLEESKLKISILKGYRNISNIEFLVYDLDLLLIQLQKLWEIYKTKFVVDQCYLEGRKYVEVAEMMSISREGVRKHITKALNILRSAFNVEKK